jgi:UDPglucose 6-dehydrogenase
MRIAILGTGYVGLSTGVCLADMGHHVVCMDVDEKKVEILKQGISPIYEPGLEELLIKNIEAGRLEFTKSHSEGLACAEIIIIAVGTPQNDDGSANLSYLEQAARDIAAHIKQDAVIVIKSTVPVGTNDRIKGLLEKELQGRHKVKMVSNPEFLRQGSAIEDTLKADRIIIGTEDEQAAGKITAMYQDLGVPFVLTDVKSAEMIKYAANAFLATKISFINEIANLCEAAGADVYDVAKGMGMDKRIGAAFLNAGIGYGGSCFPKDVKALLHSSTQFGVPFSLLKETISINERQHELLVRKAVRRFGGQMDGLKIAMLGLSFKPETDDMREAPSIKIAKTLSSLGVQVAAYDPAAMANASKVIGNSIEYAASAPEAAADADALFIVTEWLEFKELDIEALVKTMKQPIIFDGRNCLAEEAIRACEKVEYYPVGRPCIVMGNLGELH